MSSDSSPSEARASEPPAKRGRERVQLIHFGQTKAVKEKVLAFYDKVFTEEKNAPGGTPLENLP